MAIRQKVAPSTVDKAKDAAQATYTNVQGKVQAGVGKTQDALSTGLTMAQDLLKYNRPSPSSFESQKVKKAQKTAQKTAQQTAQQTQKTIDASWAQTLDLIGTGLAALQTGLKLAQITLQKNTQKAQKNLLKAQNRLKEMQERVGTGLEKTQDTLSTGSKQAYQRFSQAATTAKDLRYLAQEQYIAYQRRRKRAKKLFRWGLVLGIVLALLYTPISGSEARHRLAAQWQEYRSYVGW